MAGILELLALFITALLDVAYFVILLCINKPAKRQKINKNLPKVSVIIPAKDEPKIERTLKALKTVRYPKIEIIVAASDANTAKIARYADKVVRDRGVGKGPALNAAVEKASAEILYFLDADSMPKKTTIAEVCSSLDDEFVAAGGFNLPENKNGIVARVMRLYLAHLNKMQLGIYALLGTTVVGGRNFAVRRDALRKAGGFRNALAEDIDLSLRLFEKGSKVKFIDSACKEQVPSKFSWYFRQQQRWNAGGGSALREWKKKLRYRDAAMFLFIALMGFLPLFSLAALLAALASGNVFFLSLTFLSFLIMLSAAAMLDRDDILLLPLTFFAFIAAQSALLLYSTINRKVSWHRTPKE